MADHSDQSTVRKRATKGCYNQYLKRKDPMRHAPKTSKRLFHQSSTAEICHLPELQHAGHSNMSKLPDEEHMLIAVTADNSLAPEQLGLERDESEHNLSDSGGEADDNCDFAEQQDGMVCLDVDHIPHPEETGDIPDNYPSYDDFVTEKETASEESVSVEGDKEIYPGSRLRLGASMLLIMTFSLKYSLTGEGLSDLLQLLNLHCPLGNLVSQSLGSFRKWFQHIKHPLRVHQYCSKCHLLVSEKDCASGVCPNTKCNFNILQKSALMHFIELPIEEQVKSFFARPSFIDDISHRFQRGKKSADAIEDIYDGEVYKKLTQDGGVLQNPYNLSLLWNTDGVPCFKSSNMSLWPLFFQINELPYCKRIDPDNMILGGLWFGTSKPTVMSYTEPFIKTLRDLETVGVKIKTATSQFMSKVYLIGGTADLPARCVVCNTVQYNGKFGCCKCLQPGKTHKTSARGHVHIFPFQQDCPDGPTRTHEGNLSDVSDAIQNKAHSRGVKGPSFLQCLAHYDLVKGTCIDYMHGILLGVTKLLLSLWFSSDHSGELFSLYPYIDLVDRRLKYLKPPNNLSRLPRSIKEHLKYWKASELRSWLLYYSLPLLRDIQDRKYFQHYILFVNAVFLLLQESVSVSDLEQSKSLLAVFCCMFASLYDDRYMTCNIHHLLHLSDMVKDMGPLWAYSCFSFENANGNLLKLFNGTQNVDFQIVHTISLTQNLPYLQEQFLTPGSPEAALYNTMKGVTTRNDTLLFDDIYMVGGSNKGKLTELEQNAISQYLGHMPEQYITFNRIRISGQIFHSRKYARAHARNSYSVAYKTSHGQVKFCQIAFYAQLYPFCEEHGQMSIKCKCRVINIAVGNPLESPEDRNVCSLVLDDLTKADIFFINVLKPCDKSTACIVPLNLILYKCVFVEVKDTPDVVYACKMPNMIEKD